MENLKTKFLLIIIFGQLLFAACRKDQLLNGNQQSNGLALFGTQASVAPVQTAFEIDSVGKPIQIFTQTVTRSVERDRLKLNFIPTQLLATGFVSLPNSTITLNVELLEGSVAPDIMIGTYDRGTTTQTALRNGNNSITTTSGGIIWIIYVNNTPTSRAKITFVNGHYPIPVFIKNKTTLTQWQQQLATYNTSNDVLMIGQRVYMVYNKDLNANIASQDNSDVLSKADFAFDAEDTFSGLDGSSPLHTRIDIPHLMVHNPTTSAHMYATSFRTGYSTGDAANTTFSPGVQSWGPWHEMGHMHQQSPYQFNGLTEVTVNLYALAAERAFQTSTTRLQKDNRWPPALTFIANTDPNKSFFTSGLSEWTKLVMFHQLWLAYGDSFYQTLHKQARADTGTYSTSDEKLKNFVLKSCTISGYDLTNFFQTWGFQNVLNMYEEVAALNLPSPPVEPSTLTDDNTI